VAAGAAFGIAGVVGVGALGVAAGVTAGKLDLIDIAVDARGISALILGGGGAALATLGHLCGGHAVAASAGLGCLTVGGLTAYLNRDHIPGTLF